MRAINKMGVFLKNQVIVLAMCMIFILFSLLSSSFCQFNNAMLILRQVATFGVMGCGMTLVIIGGNFDLSVGSLVSLCCVVCVGLVNVLGPLPAMLIVLAVGAVSGLVSGFLVGYLKLNSMIVTLGMMSVLQALTLIVSNGKYIPLRRVSWFTALGQGSIGVLPISTIIMVVVIVVFATALKRTVFGHHVLAVGSNAETCRYSGINDKRVILETFVLSGISAAIGAILLASRDGAAQNNMGMGFEFDVITGVILGGTNLMGGSGNVYKTFVGMLIVAILKNGFVVIGLPYYSQWIAQCFIMIVAVWCANRAIQRKGEIE